MTRISNSDQVLAIVRAQLQRMAKRGGASKGDKTGRADKLTSPTMNSRQTIEALAQIEGLSEEAFAQALVRALLLEEFGEGFANSARFQAVVERTAKAIGEDAVLKAELARLHKAD